MSVPNWTRRSARLTALAGLCGAVGLGAGCGTGAQVTQTLPTDHTPVALGRALYATDGCSSCHSLDGARLTGPTWNGLAGSRVMLENGHTITATNAYLVKHIVEPNAFTVRGYTGQIMAESIEQLDLRRKPADVQALVAFIDSLR